MHTTVRLRCNAPNLTRDPGGTFSRIQIEALPQQFQCGFNVGSMCVCGGGRVSLQDRKSCDMLRKLRLLSEQSSWDLRCLKQHWPAGETPSSYKLIDSPLPPSLSFLICKMGLMISVRGCGVASAWWEELKKHTHTHRRVRIDNCHPNKQTTALTKHPEYAGHRSSAIHTCSPLTL